LRTNRTDGSAQGAALPPRARGAGARGARAPATLSAVSESTRPQRTEGFLTTLRAALNAGAVVGFAHGLFDGVLAGLASELSTPLQWAGCLAASALSYGLVWCAVLLLAAPFAHFVLRGQGLLPRLRAFTMLGLGLAIFVELYWWSRPYVYSGLAATDPRRLAAAGGMLVVALGVGFLVVHSAKRASRGAKWLTLALIPLAWFGGAAFLVSERAQGSERGAIQPHNRDLPNVLLVVCDALRADVLGCYGNATVKTPVLDDLAARGVLFENAIVQAPFTWSSFGSILTGKYPRRHGLVKMDPSRRMKPNVTLPWHLKSAKFASGPEGNALSEADYFGATFMTGTLSHGSGLMRGFDVYYEALVGHELVDTGSVWSVFRSKLVLSIVRNKVLQKMDASRVVSVAREWFRENGHRRFVAMVHLYATHTPYDPPKEFRAMYCDPAYNGPIPAFYAEHRIAIEQGKGALTPADERQIQNLYYAGVSQTDAMIGQLLDELRHLGQLDRTLVIVTADHGEELGDHGLWEHNWPFQTNLRVPLIAALPGKLPAGARVAAGVESIDIVPTVCDLLGLLPPNEPDEPDGRGLVDGKSLLPLIRGEATSVREHAFSENGLFLAVQDTAASGPRYKLVIPIGGDCSKALEPNDGAPFRPVLYRLDTDPGETKNLLNDESERAQRLLDALCAHDKAMPIPQDDVVQSDRDLADWEQIHRALGYTGDSRPAIDATSKKL
jgi:arylsulfatase A-like enzyme